MTSSRVENSTVAVASLAVVGFDVGKEAFDAAGHARVAPDAERRLDAGSGRSAKVEPVALAVFLPTAVLLCEANVGKRQELDATADPNGGAIKCGGRHVLGLRGRNESRGPKDCRRKSRDQIRMRMESIPRDQML